MKKHVYYLCSLFFQTKAFKNVLFRIFQTRRQPILLLRLCTNDTLKIYIADVHWLNAFSRNSANEAKKKFRPKSTLQMRRKAR